MLLLGLSVEKRSNKHKEVLAVKQKEILMAAREVMGMLVNESKPFTNEDVHKAVMALLDVQNPEWLRTQSYKAAEEVWRQDHLIGWASTGVTRTKPLLRMYFPMTTGMGAQKEIRKLRDEIKLAEVAIVAAACGCDACRSAHAVA